MMHPPPLEHDDALFLDLDGTLAPIIDDPDSVTLGPDAQRAVVRAAQATGGAVAIISGRSLKDLIARAPASVWRIGAHGLERAAPGETLVAPLGHAPEALRRAMEILAASDPALRLERKGPVLALHYRAAPGRGADLVAAARAAAESCDGYRVQQGKMVIELKPEGADKGAALSALMERAPFAGRRPVMAGDDATDEDAMAAAAAMGGYGVKVGAGETAARFRLPDPHAVARWLMESFP